MSYIFINYILFTIKNYCGKLYKVENFALKQHNMEKRGSDIYCK